MSRRYLALVCSLLLLLASGCSQQSSAPLPNDEEHVNKGAEVETEQQQMDIQLFYADDQILGLQETTAEIKFEDDVDKYKQAFLGLTTSSDDTLIPIWEKEALEKVSFEAGTLNFQFKEPSEQHGSSVESLQIESLLKTMFQFPEVEEISINNLDQETYSGQIDISEPFTRETLADQ
ncbi:hypothetical protein BEP19_06400 [Ammoniphilus oxalaticus]|uniref:GerMN domain-containing protein n=1 Tax=Ammoniphilus oxalaticus TaxID=66863 RepID=A0A419SJ73_9BACL|nr:GerMN domain-containing protein [Ammoniphilus oxalaticus]RKD24035.1 hypothetical protein BEP19_06400 [Ammoniphilus oxalaticus]